MSRKQCLPYMATHTNIYILRAAQDVQTKYYHILHTTTKSLKKDCYNKNY